MKEAINKKRPKGMPRWKWRENLTEEEKEQPQKELDFSSMIKMEVEKDKKKEAIIGSIVFFGIGLIILLTLLYWFVYCPLSESCRENASKIPSVPSEYECRQDPLSPECQDIYYSNPLR